MRHVSRRDTNSPRDHPKGTQVIRGDFYSIHPVGDDLADVFLFPEGRIYDIGDGRREYDVTALVVRGVATFPGMEDSIRANYSAWCEIGEPID